MDQPLTQAHLTVAVKEIVTHFNESQSQQSQRFDARFDGIDRRLDGIADDVRLLKRAVLDLAADVHLHNLVRELRAKGIELDESKIFVAT